MLLRFLLGLEISHDNNVRVFPSVNDLKAGAGGHSLNHIPLMFPPLRIYPHHFCTRRRGRIIIGQCHRNHSTPPAHAGDELLSHKTIATTSTAPRTPQQIARLCSPANQNPDAALKQRVALVHPLAQAAGLLNICNTFISPHFNGWISRLERQEHPKHRFSSPI